MEVSIENMPDEIIEYYQIMGITGGLMGLKMYERCEQIIENNPLYFPWETKYKSLPKEVHEAYLNEKNPDRNLTIEEYNAKHGESIGLIPSIMKMKTSVINYNPSSGDFSLSESIKMLIDTQSLERKSREQREKREKELWDKHYKKHGLEYKK